MLVSIPHRYGKNLAFNNIQIHSILVSIPHRYGKNASPDTKIFMKILFPFLIGTVRTEPPISKPLFDENVSIPHRYGKNASYSL